MSLAAVFWLQWLTELYIFFFTQIKAISRKTEMPTKRKDFCISIWAFQVLQGFAPRQERPPWWNAFPSFPYTAQKPWEGRVIVLNFNSQYKQISETDEKSLERYCQRKGIWFKVSGNQYWRQRNYKSWYFIEQVYMFIITHSNRWAIITFNASWKVARFLLAYRKWWFMRGNRKVTEKKCWLN